MRLLERCRPLIGMVCCLMLLACGSELGGTKPAGARPGQEGQSGPLRLDLANRTLVYPIGSGIAEPEKLKFVQVEIGELINPGLVRISFELRYRPETGTEVFLGTFSPFPPDNPGTYIVSTRGSLRPGGAILLSMVPLDEVGPDDEVQVHLKAISFREE
jgi:hypothetical protein